MAHFLSPEELERVKPGQKTAFRSPVPTQIVSNGEFTPLPQTEEQREVEARVKALADHHAKRQGVSRHEFLGTAAGMAAAFLAMNEVFGPFFKVSAADAAEPHRASARRRYATSSSSTSRRISCTMAVNGRNVSPGACCLMEL